MLNMSKGQWLALEVHQDSAIKALDLIRKRLLMSVLLLSAKQIRWSTAGTPAAESFALELKSERQLNGIVRGTVRGQLERAFRSIEASNRSPAKPYALSTLMCSTEALAS